MKKMLTTLAIAVFGFTFAQAQQESNENAPEITFEENVIDYGTIDRNSNGTRVFVFTNTGQEPLIISNLQGSCGCTTPDRSIVNRPFAPGESGELKVRYDTNRLGRFQKTVTVTSNAKSSSVRLTIKGNVREPQTTPVNENSESSRVSR